MCGFSFRFLEAINLQDNANHNRSMAINAGSTDDLIRLPWDHETTTETGAYFSPAMLGPIILSTTCAPLNRNSAIDVDGYYCHGESQTSSGFWSEIMTGAPLLPISGELIICKTFMLIILSSSCRTFG